ncbi:iron complex outermembrane receptor protein [Sphingopyxis panaciterrae]|uniref:TonB-dependent receptor domain-containing protein n=1 Tax=Sphingopyxis panaciterrae TaxID=363841 RepID=UPI0014223A2D|nr:TonB-dependent receptor [Sphingopyxis panaciterrae]NIJ35879.1 iron complex outermembrane receptor protein [Sphingopyxis panaciterrae]
MKAMMAAGPVFLARRETWRRGVSALACAGALLGASGARAQEADSDPAGAAGDADIVVTGTLLRGAAPTGTNVVGVSRDDVTVSGAANANELLAAIPQVGNFMTQPVGTGQFGAPTVRPNIRNLGSSGGATTLVLMNGHRLVGAGILQTTVDPSIIPPDVIERVEIVPDGGSAIYGSDAIGGVINFITRKRFDGIGANARYGFADNYQSFDGNVTAGKDWGSGSLFVSYAYAWHDNIQGIDRDYSTADNSARGGTDFRQTTCAPGNVTDLQSLLSPLLPNINYALPGFTPGVVNKCDQTDFADIYPRETRHSVFAGLNQQLSDDIEFNMTAYWSRRDTQIRQAQAGFTGTITALNPYFRPLSFSPAQNIAISFADVFGDSLISNQRFDSWGVTPSFAIKLGGGWQLRAEGNYGRSYNLVREGAINASAATLALAGTTLATALNPYNPSASNPAVLAAIRDFENYGEAKQQLAEARLVLDGSLVTIAGGDVRVAIGAEYHYEDLASRISLDRRNVFTNAINSKVSRNVKSVYGELLVPIIGEGNGSPGLRGLQFSGSIRLDDYNDVGSTTNPKIGFNYKPFNDLTIRGNWGTSFHAPSLADTTSTADARAQILLNSPFIRPGDSLLNFLRPTIVLAGGNPNLKPERADTWSLGFDWKPDAVPGLRASATYWNVKFKDAIGLAPFLSPTLYTDQNFASFYILNPTLAQAQAAVGNLLLNGAPSLASLYPGLPGAGPYVLIDARRNNLGRVNSDGLDFDVAYVRPTGFGSINASFAGTYTLNRETQAIAGGATTDNLKNGTGRFFFVAGLGGTVGDFTAHASLNHRGGFPIVATTQDHISSFNTVDLFFSYDLKALLPDTSLTVNIDNVFDQDPPFFDSQTGYTNGGTLGRMISFGIRTKF